MARIRTIKPEFWTNERVMECSKTARLMFIGMWNFADDLGRLPLSAKTIKAQIFPSDDISSGDILGMVGELSANGLVLTYEVEGRQYIQIVGWQHQRIDKPQPGKCPSPVNGYSKSVPGMVATEGKVGDSKVEEGNSEANASGAVAPPDPSVAEREYFDRGKQILGKSAGGQLAKLKTAKGGNVALARAVLETASTKQNPAEYIAGAIRAGTDPPPRAMTVAQRNRQETREILNELEDFARRGGGSGEADFGLLPGHPGERSEALRGGAGRAVIDLSGGGRRESG